MSREFEGETWILPVKLFTDLRDPASVARFKALMKFQYGEDLPDEILDKSVEQLKWQEYWQKEAPNYLVTIRNENSPRFGQVGGLLGYLSNEK